MLDDMLQPIPCVFSSCIYSIECDFFNKAGVFSNSFQIYFIAKGQRKQFFLLRQQRRDPPAICCTLLGRILTRQRCSCNNVTSISHCLLNLLSLLPQTW